MIIGGGLFRAKGVLYLFSGQPHPPFSSLFSLVLSGGVVFLFGELHLVL
jgi:hypothetical protein